MERDRNSPVGAAFAKALAAKDFDAAGELLDPGIDFRAVTPGRAWEAQTRSEVVDQVLRQWFEDSDEIEELVALETDSFADRERVGYRLRGRNPDGEFLVEQQAYLSVRAGRIDWMRVTCSGFRPPSPADDG